VAIVAALLAIGRRTPVVGYEAKLSGAPVDQVRPELQRYRACQFISRHGEVAVKADLSRSLPGHVSLSKGATRDQ
jgi:hypothetical protein